MDLLATVRKEGSRGGQGDFKWSDVQNSTRREHYLGHSLMAPVGRWAKGRDLSWYAKADDGADGEDPTAKAARERKEEIQLIKQAEEDALARALGLPVPDRNNANLQPVSDKREVEKILKEGAAGDDETGRGIGYGTRLNAPGVTEERLEGVVTTIEKIGDETTIVNVDTEIHVNIAVTIADMGPETVEIVLVTNTEVHHATVLVGTGRDQEVLDVQTYETDIVPDRAHDGAAEDILVTALHLHMQSCDDRSKNRSLTVANPCNV